MRAFPVSGALSVFALMAALAGAAASTPAEAQSAGKTTITPSGLQITDSKVGTGATPKPGQTCVMHYTGWLYQNGAKGKKFDSSVDRGKPFEFPIGQGRVIRGWDEGVATMKVGGKRTLIIPPALGYGASGAGGVITAQRIAGFRRRIARRGSRRRSSSERSIQTISRTMTMTAVTATPAAVSRVSVDADSGAPYTPAARRSAISAASNSSDDE